MSWLRRKRLRKLVALHGEMIQTQKVLRHGRHVSDEGRNHMRDRVVKLERRIEKLERRI